VIAVAASDSDNNRAYFSSTGPAVELIAPGVSISSTKLGGGYVAYNGTSMASPHVAGAAALVLGANSGLSNTLVRDILRSTAWDLELPLEHQGFGLVRANLAVAMALDTDGSETEPDPPASGSVVVQSVTYATRGGNRHLDVIVKLVDSAGNPVGGASVSIRLFRDGTLLWSPAGTTGSNGTVTFSINNAPSGTYTTKVNSVSASGLTWDGITPPNIYTK
jgi:subtilisin family serine protease